MGPLNQIRQIGVSYEFLLIIFQLIFQVIIARRLQLYMPVDVFSFLLPASHFWSPSTWMWSSAAHITTCLQHLMYGCLTVVFQFHGVRFVALNVLND